MAKRVKEGLAGEYLAKGFWEGTTVAQVLGRAVGDHPRQAYLTHMTHDLDHNETNRRLPAGVELAYNGLEIDL